MQNNMVTKLQPSLGQLGAGFGTMQNNMVTKLLQFGTIKKNKFWSYER